MSRDWTLYLEDIVDACRLIERFTAGMSGESFAGNALAFHATVRNASRALAEADQGGDFPGEGA